MLKVYSYNLKPVLLIVEKMEREFKDIKNMKSTIKIRNYRLEDAKALMDIFFNTIHKINIKDYTQAQVDAWAPEKI